MKAIKILTMAALATTHSTIARSWRCRLMARSFSAARLSTTIVQQLTTYTE